MTTVNGILLLYCYPIYQINANTIMEHVNAFEKHSKFDVYAINMEYGFPESLQNLHFKIIITHYSTVRTDALESFKDYLKNEKDAYKIAFFQDEHHFCKERFDFINQFKIDCIFTLIEPRYFKDTYEKFSPVKRIVYCIPGYVSDDLIDAASKFGIPDEKRLIDIGYRGRQLAYYMGKGSQEKKEIGEQFLQRAKGLNLRLNIETHEIRRIYGDDWLKFFANCRGMLGVEAGVSIFDIDGTVYQKYQKEIEKNPQISFEEMSNKLNFDEVENKIYYRTISPRHFEAAAFRVCQILYEGNYSGILKSMVHYLPLKKDFSNFDEIIRLFQDPVVRKTITDNTYRDLIASEKYHYNKFIQDFDQVLIDAGMNPKTDPNEHLKVLAMLNKGKTLRKIKALIQRGMRFGIQVVLQICHRYNLHPGKFIPLRIRKVIDSITSKIL